MGTLWHIKVNRSPSVTSEQEQSVSTGAPADAPNTGALSMQQPIISNQNQSAYFDHLQQARKEKPAPLSNKNSTSNGMLLLTEKSGVPIFFEGTPTEHWLEGNITNPETGTGISGATLTIQNLKTSDEYKVDSDSDGYFSRKLPFGDYKVIVSYPGLQPESRHCKISKERGCYVTFGGLQKAALSDSPNSNSTRDNENRFNYVRVLESDDYYAQIEVSYYYNGDKDDIDITLWMVNATGSRFGAGHINKVEIFRQKAITRFNYSYSGTGETSAQAEVCM